MWDGDHTLWAPDPTEISDRLGWLRVGPEVLADRDRLEGFADACHADGLRHVVVMGMGGSSLFPEVIARTFATGDGRLQLHVLDTTDPQAVARVEAVAPLGETLFVASSKSGSTIETRSHLAHFWDRVGNPAQFAVVTDPGSELGDLARERGFREVFENRSDIGGRYSALSYFGLVPAALAGAPWTDLVASAEALAPSLGPDADPAANPGLRLGAVLGAAVKAGRDKLTLVIDESVATLRAVARAAHRRVDRQARHRGRAGGRRGARPGRRVRRRPPLRLDRHASGRRGGRARRPGRHRPPGGRASASATRPTSVPRSCSGRWPRPSAARSSASTPSTSRTWPRRRRPRTRCSAAARPTSRPARSTTCSPRCSRATTWPSRPTSIPGTSASADLEEARLRIRDEHKVATTFGLGPRFLHSTGQLHKGGPPTGVFVQVVGDDVADTPGAGPAVHVRRAQARAGRRRPADVAQARSPRRAGTRAGSDRPRLTEERAMKLGMIGLGKMGGNMAERLRRHGHEVVGMDPSRRRCRRPHARRADPAPRRGRPAPHRLGRWCRPGRSPTTRSPGSPSGWPRATS